MENRSGEAPARDARRAVVIGEEALDHVAHFLGNAFQRVYHVSNRVRETDATAADDLESTARRLEEFLRLWLDYLSPPDLAAQPVPATEIVASLAARIEAALGAPPTVFAGGIDATRVRVDPGRLAQVFAWLGARLASTCRRQERLRLDVGATPAGLVVTVRLPGRCLPNSSSELALQWLAAQRLVELHGGTLGENAAESGGTSWEIVLPLEA